MADAAAVWVRMGLIVGLVVGLGVGASAESPVDPDAPRAEAGFEDLLERLRSNPLGRFYLKLRPRYEFADVEGSRDSHAGTLRGVLGFGSRAWHGFSFLVEGEGIATLDTDWYFDGTGDPNGRSLVPDPPHIDLNQGYVHYENADWTTNLRGGRQRVLLDDERFVGNVGWRQNEQTFDAALVSTGLGRRDVQLTYAFVAEVLRIFGDQSPSSSRDFDSSSHLLNGTWRALPELRLTAFAYLLDFDNAAPSSSNTYGARAVGTFEIDRSWQLDYALSYAYQTDAANNRDDYAAHYAWAEGRLAREEVGSVAVGFELLGSDDGEAVFGTPLGTLHKFNGLADVFLDNGGPRGLRDLFVHVTPELPFRLDGELAFHRFWADDGGRRLGWEIDAVLSRPIGRYVTVLAKTAYFHRTTSASRRPRVLRAWLQLTLEF